ncbi:MAG: PepSY domain-containing protein [Proteobacteria bacterium]|nr:PepSY domain-containing protein [Pseudomonadota bacterium]
MKTKSLIAAAVLGTAAASSLVFAATKHMEHDEVPALKAQLAAAKIGFGEAIAAAESHVQGKATRAALEDEAGKFAYNIEVLKGDQLTDVSVDSRNGKVLSATADQHDREGEREDKD